MFDILIIIYATPQVYAILSRQVKMTAELATDKIWT